MKTKYVFRQVVGRHFCGDRDLTALTLWWRFGVMWRFLISMAAILFLSSIVLAEVPPTISYQGILKDSTGLPVEDDVYAIKFAIYDDSGAGSPLWETAGYVPIQTHDGLFTHILGSTNPIPDSIALYDDLWIGMRVNLEPEMTPRTRLTSVPFAMKAEYADTATVARDKTVDAAELTTGVLDTARFSAYGDLLSEDKIGPAPDQVAVGNHMHTGVSFPGTMVRLEDTTEIEYNLPPGGIIKSLSVPYGFIGNYFRVSYALECVYGVNSGAVYVYTNINNQSLTSHLNYGIMGGKTSCIITGQKLTDDRWLICYEYFGAGLGNHSNFEEFTLDMTVGLTISISAYNNNEQGGKLKMGILFLEYDVD